MHSGIPDTGAAGNRKLKPPMVQQMNVMRRKGRCHNAPLTVTNCLRITGLLLIIGMVTGCAANRYSGYRPETKLPPGQLKSDLQLLKTILEANHPGLYWYTKKDSVDLYFDQALAGITDSMTEFAFRSRVAWWLSKLKCGHTTVQPSKAYGAYAEKNDLPKFPLVLKAWGDSLVVLGSLNAQDSVLKRGTVITGIEQRSNHEMLDSMFRFISTDGYADNFKNQAVSFNFPLYYSFAFPLKDSFEIQYLDSTGLSQTRYVKLYRPLKDTTQQQRGPRPERGARRNFTIDTTAGLAYMRVATFSYGKLNRFFKNSFSILEQENIPNLVIDLRENTGGRIGYAVKLAQYLTDSSFRVADTAAAISRSMPYGKYIHPSFSYRVLMRFTTKKKADGKFHFTSLEKRTYTPRRNQHYDGNIFILQGGFTFSAAAMLSSTLKGQDNVVIAGEESGGGYYGTSAIHLPSVVLPASKLQVVLPLYRLVQDKTRPNNGRGVMPDVYIPPSSVAIRNAEDVKLQQVKSMIEAGKPLQ